MEKSLFLIPPLLELSCPTYRISIWADNYTMFEGDFLLTVWPQTAFCILNLHLLSDKRLSGGVGKVTSTTNQTKITWLKNHLEFFSPAPNSLSSFPEESLLSVKYFPVDMSGEWGVGVECFLLPLLGVFGITGSPISSLESWRLTCVLSGFVRCQSSWEKVSPGQTWMYESNEEKDTMTQEKWIRQQGSWEGAPRKTRIQKGPSFTNVMQPSTPPPFRGLCSEVLLSPKRIGYFMKAWKQSLNMKVLGSFFFSLSTHLWKSNPY